MTDLSRIYVPLDTAREELARRRSDPSLLKRVQDALGESFIPEFEAQPRGVVWKYIVSPDNGFAYFLHQCAYAKVAPLALEYRGDMFLTLNEEKKGLGRLRIRQPDGRKEIVEVMDFPANQRKRMDETTLTNGERLMDFHHRLLDVSGYDTQLRDNTEWAHARGKPAEYYYPYLAHFLAHGILFEAYLTDDPDEREVAFTRDVVAPAMERLEKDFQLRPLIVRLFPEQQDAEEDFYWWSYPPQVNEFLRGYVDVPGFKTRSAI